jgi:methyl-accepting chemotaxis protein
VSWSQVGLKWVARCAAVAAVVLFALVIVAIHRGRVVQATAQELVATLHTNNGYFDNRVDFTMPGRIRDEVRALHTVLDQLDRSTNEDVGLLDATLPDVARLLEAGRGDVQIAQRLTGVAGTLRDAARDLRKITGDADGTVDSVDRRVATAVELVDRLDRELTDIDRKLGVLPR